jgi:periplasmic copper chaperone A
MFNNIIKKKGKFMKFIFVLSIFFSLIFISCNKSEKNDKISHKNPIEISEAWMRVGSLNRNTAAFFKIKNNTEINDTLFDVSSDLAKEVQIHETYSKGADMKGMRHVDEIVIKPHTTLEFHPDGYHVMFIGLNKDLAKGEVGKLSLYFKNNDKINIEAEVK